MDIKNIGVVYQTREIRKILDISNYEIDSKYKLVGLRFSKKNNSSQTVDRGQPTRATLKSNVALLIKAVFYRPFPVDLVYKDIPTNLVPNASYVFQHLNSHVFIKEEELNFTTQTNIQVSDFEFWDSSVGFVVFGKDELEILMSSKSEIIFSGAKVDYGIGIKDYNFNNRRTYATLKAEVASKPNKPSKPSENSKEVAKKSQQTNGDVRPESINAISCPPWWGPGVVRTRLNILQLNMVVMTNSNPTFDQAWNGFITTSFKDIGFKYSGVPPMNDGVIPPIKPISRIEIKPKTPNFDKKWKK